MSEPRSASPSNGDEVPPWMTSVSEETLYNADGDSPSDPPTPTDPSPEAPSPSPPEAAHSSPAFEEHLTLALATPSALPEPDPDLQPTVVGRVRTDLDRQFEKALSVLGARYAKDVPRSLVLEFVLRRTLRELRAEGDESPLVEWLDSVLPRD